MTRKIFIEKWGDPLFNEEAPGQSFASDLDTLLKERMREAWAASKYEYTDYKPIGFNEWYDTFIKEQ